MNEIIEDVGVLTQQLTRTRYRNQRNAIIIFGIVWYPIVGAIAYFMTDLFLMLDDLIIVVIALPIMIWIYWYAGIKSKIATLFMKQFAIKHGYTYATIGNTRNLDGTLFAIGHKRHVEDVVSGMYTGHPLRLFTYHYATGSGNTEKTYDYMVFELTFDTQLPRILVRSKDQRFASTAVIGSSFDHPNEVRLEGNFGDHFEFGVDEQYEIEALQIFTPDFMAQLIDLQQKFSIELINCRLYIYSDKVIERLDELIYFYETAKWLCQRMSPILPRLKKDVQAMQSAFSK